MLILVRHGRTEANARGLLLGRLDPTLDEVGRRQAAGLAKALPHDGRVVCSPLRRTRETAAAFGLPVTVDERWIELDYGVWDGKPIKDIDVEQWAAWRADPAFAPKGGESLRDVGERVRVACNALMDEAAERDVIVVSHVSPIKAAVAWALDVDDAITWRLFLAPASVTRIATDRGTPSVHTFNESVLPVE